MDSVGKYRDTYSIKNALATTHGIVHAGFSGFQRFVARKKVQCKLIGNRFVIPHVTIPSTVMCKCRIKTIPILETYNEIRKIC